MGRWRRRREMGRRKTSSSRPRSSIHDDILFMLLFLFR